METKEEIKERIYQNNGILNHWDREIKDVMERIEKGRMPIRPYGGRIFRPFELRNLKELLDNLKKAKERTVVFIKKLEKDLEEVNK